MAPLAFWRGEKVTYARGYAQAEIVEVNRVPPAPVKPLGAAKRTSAKTESRGRSASARPSPNEDMYRSYEDHTQQYYTVSTLMGEEVERRECCFVASQA